MQTVSCSPISSETAAMHLLEWLPQARGILNGTGASASEAIASAAPDLCLSPAVCEVPLPRCFRDDRQQVGMQECHHPLSVINNSRTMLHHEDPMYTRL